MWVIEKLWALHVKNHILQKMCVFYVNSKHPGKLWMDIGKYYRIVAIELDIWRRDECKYNFYVKLRRLYIGVRQF